MATTRNKTKEAKSAEVRAPKIRFSCSEECEAVARNLKDWSEKTAKAAHKLAAGDG